MTTKLIENIKKAKQNYNSIIATICIIVGLVFTAWLIFPDIFTSEEELCDNAIYDAKDNLQYELSDWINGPDNLDLQNGERIVSYSVTGTDCEVISRFNSEVDVTFEIGLKTSLNHHIAVEAYVETYDGYAESYDFYAGQ